MSCGHRCDCPTYRDHLLSVNFSASAMPTRSQSKESLSVAKTEAGWEKDLPAYKRLRRDGLQPPHIDGSAKLEAVARDKVEVEAGKSYGNKLSIAKDVKTVLTEAGIK